VAPAPARCGALTEAVVKVAWVSNILPPSHTAHAAILHRLLRDRDPATYCLLSARNYADGAQEEWSGRLAGRYYHLHTWRLTRGYRFGLARVRAAVNLVLDLRRVSTIARILRRERCDAVVACTGGDEIVDFAAAYLASRLTGLPFYAYLLDQFSHMVRFGLGRTVVGRLEPSIMKRAAAVIVPNEFLAEEVRREFGIDPVVIHNPCDLQLYDNVRDREAEKAAGERSIVYTGEIGEVHFGAFRNLLAAIDLPGENEVRLHLYSNSGRTWLETHGIRGPVVFHGQHPLAEMPSIHKRADILFLPLSIESPYGEIIRTAAPGKMGEYLAARRPILVHAPADSFVAWYFRRHECGLVVDRDDPAELAHALRRLLSDTALCRTLSERAWERARADFDVEKARAQVDALLGW
jgi:glycosyltransferase involved in cell wall biosynthesis